MLSVELRVIEGSLRVKQSFPNAIHTIKKVNNDLEERSNRRSPYGHRSPQRQRNAQPELEQLHRDLVGDGQHLKIMYDRQTGRITVNLVDNTDGRIIREIPENKAKEILRSLSQWSGLIMDEYA